MNARTRSRGSISQVVKGPSIYNLNVNCGNPNWVLYGADPDGPSYGSYEIMSDFVVPGFHRRSQRGEVFFNPMSHDRYSYDVGSGQSYHIRRTITSPCTPPVFAEWRREGNQFPMVAQLRPNGSFTGPVPARSIIDSDSIADAVTEASTRARSNVGMSNTNLYETLAEADQVLGMYNQTLKNAQNVLSRVPYRPLKGMTNAYLLYRYGMKPVIEDINNVVKQLDVVTQRIRSTARGSASISRTESNVYNINFHGYLNVMTAFSDTDDVKVRAMVLQEYILTRLNASGFSTKGLLTLPWELVPYSFVIDMFVNVGDLLGSLLPAPGYSDLGSCLTIERTIRSSASPIATNSTTSEWTIVRPITGSCEAVIHSKSRSGLGGSGLVVKSSASLLNLQKALDLTALTVQKLLVLGALPSYKPSKLRRNS